MSVPTQQKALFLQDFKGEWAVKPIVVPQPAAGQVLLRLEATALNPIDWKLRDYDLGPRKWPVVLGFDGAGVVVKVGDAVTGVAVGDKVVVEADINDSDTATFQQYALAPADLVAKIPANVTFDDAATIPAALATAAVGFYGPRKSGIRLVAPWNEGGRGKYAGQPLLIIGGATSLGQAAIQLAKISGFSPIITTASLSNDAYLKSVGATHTIDRALPLADLSANIAKITSSPVELIFDAVGIDFTQSASYSALAPGGTLIVALPSNITEFVDGKQVFAPYGSLHVPDNREFGVELWAHVTEFLESGQVKPNRVDYIPGGLASIPDALDRLRNNQVSGKKLVVHPTETV